MKSGSNPAPLTLILTLIRTITKTLTHWYSWKEIATIGASDWEAYTIDNVQYLAVANSNDGDLHLDVT